MANCRNAVVVLALCSACSSSTIQKVGSQYVKDGTFGAAGGQLTVAASDDAALAGTSINIPAGALSRSTHIQIGVTNRTVVSSGSVGPVIDFEPSGTVFSQPATVTIPVTLPQGFDPSHVGVMAVEADGTSHDITAVTVSMTSATSGLATFQVTGFTDYGGHDEGEDRHDGGDDRQDGGTCTSTCGDDAECGASNGCGGICDHNCHHDDGGDNRADSGVCTPHCGDDAECGASNGCGGVCDRNCHHDDGGDNTADSGTCTPHCGGDAACGAADGCGGTCDANCQACNTDGGETTCRLDDRSYCADLSLDPNNCGACGTVCGEETSACVHGECTCKDGLTLCGDPDAGVPNFCLNTSENVNNCGACGNVCTDSYAVASGCRFGACTCSPGQTRLCGTAGTDGAACVSNDLPCPGGDDGG